MLRRPVSRLLIPLLSLLALAGCDGEPVDVSGARYDVVLNWIGGEKLDRLDQDVSYPGVYGTPGVASATNTPGARESAMRWQDAAGNVWLFGGRGLDAGSEAGRLHDLWTWSPASRQWTWVGGRDTIGDTLINDGRGVYGTRGVPAPANLPGARHDGVTWVDAGGNFWLFGGFGLDSAGATGRLNDLWTYNPVSGEWAWVSGSDLIDDSGVYGTPGTPDNTSHPGARYQATGWVDAAGALVLFGGEGRDGSGGCCSLNDLWKFDTVSGEWTWLSGSSAVNGVATFGTAGVTDAANTPSGRFGSVSWRDGNGMAWLYGGTANNERGERYLSAELWRYQEAATATSAAGWAWVSGAQGAHAAPVNNARCTPSLSTSPGSRTGAVAWLGADNSLWLFGGSVEPISGSVSHRNDVWRYKDVAWTWVGGSRSTSFGRYNELNGSGQPAGRVGSTGWTEADGSLWLFGGRIDSLLIRNDNRLLNDLWRYQPTFLATDTAQLDCSY